MNYKIKNLQREYGGGGIRTRGIPFGDTLDFQSSAFDRSATPPILYYKFIQNNLNSSLIPIKNNIKLIKEN